MVIRTFLAVATTAVLVAGTASAESVSYKLDPTHTIVVFEVRHAGMSTSRALIRAKEGLVVLDRQAKTGKVEVVIDIATLTTAVPSQAEYLRGAELFNVTTNPTASFESDQVNFDGDKVASVGGRMTIAGKTTQPVMLKGTPFGCGQHMFAKREACGGDFETVIQRSQFGLSQMPKVASEDVRLLIQVEGIRSE